MFLFLAFSWRCKGVIFLHAVRDALPLQGGRRHHIEPHGEVRGLHSSWWAVTVPGWNHSLYVHMYTCAEARRAKEGLVSLLPGLFLPGEH